MHIFSRLVLDSKRGNQKILFFSFQIVMIICGKSNNITTSRWVLAIFMRGDGMRKQVLRTVLATATAFSIAAMPALTVCAEDVTEPVMVERGTEEIDGGVNVTLSKYQGNALYAGNEGELIIDGDVSITRPDASYAMPVSAYYDSSIWIKGDYKYESNYNGFASISNDGSTIVIDGNYDSNQYGAKLVDGNIYVDGDLSAECDALNLQNLYEDSKEYAVVDGTVTSKNGNAIAINSYKSSKETVERLVDQLPDIAVFALDAKDDEHLISADGLAGINNLPEAEAAAIKQEAVDLLSAAINYIIRTEGTDFSFEGEGLKTASDFGIDDPDKDFTTTRYGETFTATVASNYVVEGNNSVEVEKISDGVYSVKLIDHKGGILLKATALSSGPDQPLVIVVPESEESSGSDSESSSSESSAVSYSAIPVGAITISLPRTTAATAVAAAGPAVLGAIREPARAVTLKMAKLTDAQYKDAVIKNISDTPAGGLFRMETDRIATLDRAMLETFAKRGSVDMEVLFPLGSEKISVTIPAGYDINKLLDNKGYCGYLRLLALLGGEIVTQ